MSCAVSSSNAVGYELCSSLRADIASERGFLSRLALAGVGQEMVRLPLRLACKAAFRPLADLTIQVVLTFLPSWAFAGTSRRTVN